MHKEVISNRQFMLLITMCTLPTAILYVPQAVTSSAGRDGWYLVLVSGAVGIVNTLIFVWLGRMYPGKNFLEIARVLLGRYLGGLFNFVYLFYLMDLTTWVLRAFTNFLLVTVEPETPFYTYLIIGGILATFAVFHGLEVLARITEIIFPIIFCTYILIFCLLIDQYHPEYLQPVLEDGLLQPLHSLILPVSWYGDVMIISMFVNHVRFTRQTPLYAVTGMGMTIFFLATAIIAAIMVLGAETTATLTFPTYSLIQNISIANVFERIDVLIVTIWMFGAFVKFSFYLMGGVYGLSKVLHLQHPRWIILPLAVCMVIDARLKATSSMHVNVIFVNSAWYFFLFQFVLPFCLLCWAVLMKKWKSKTA